MTAAGPGPEPAASGGPLHGIRVLELASPGPGPHAAMILADLGADVVRIERPPGRGLRETTATRSDHLLRGRRSVAADLKQESDRALVKRLVDRADVLLEGLRPGVTERLGLGPQTCLRDNPRLVYARITGWGQTGPLAGQVGHDINHLGLSGALAAIGRPGSPPAPPLSLVADYAGGSLLCVVGILAALLERGRSGRGQVVDAASVDGVSLLSQLIWVMRGQQMWTDTRGENLLDGGAPFYDTYACSDGRYVAVGALEPRFYAALLEGLDLDRDTLPDRDDPDQWPALRACFQERFAARTRQEWEETFTGTLACVTPVLDYAEAVDHPHLRARGTHLEIAGVTQAAPAPRFSRTPAARPTPPPVPGADRDAVLADWCADTSWDLDLAALDIGD